MNLHHQQLIAQLVVSFWYNTSMPSSTCSFTRGIIVFFVWKKTPGFI